MGTKEYIEFHRNCCNKMIEITAKKNHDYAGFGDDAFSNFRVVEECGIASVEQGFLTRMMDKISRINSFAKQGMLKVSDESIEDTLLDLANYSILLAGYIKDKKNRNKRPEIRFENGYLGIKNPYTSGELLINKEDEKTEINVGDNTGLVCTGCSNIHC